MKLASVAALAALIAFPSAAQAALSAETLARVDHLFVQLQKDDPALAVAVMQKGDVVYQQAFGAADIEQGVPATLGTRFHVASTSKEFTALSVLLLADEGKVDIDADIRTYLPYVPDFGRKITVANLLNHTSGLRDQWGLFGLSGTEQQSVRPQAEIFELVRRQTALNFEPGSEFDYCNTGYSLLADIVQRVSGQSLRQFTTERIFRPLGMDHTYFYDDLRELLPHRAVSYVLRPDGTPQLQRLNSANVGATSLTTTAPDLLKWGQELLHPRVFPPALIARMGTPGRLSDGTPLKYADGLYQSEIAGHKALGHDGAEAGFRASFQTFPADDTVVVVLTSGARQSQDYLRAVADVVLNGGVGAPPAMAPPPPPTVLNAYAGDYFSAWTKGMHLTVSDGGLWVSTAEEAKLAVRFRPDGALDLGAMGTFRPRYGSGGQVTALDQEARFGGHPIAYTRAVLDVPSPGALAAVVGLYRSQELDITYSLAVCSGHLVASTLQHPQGMILWPADHDRFDSSGERWTVIRDTQGHVTQLLLDSGGGRVHNLALQRLSGSSAQATCPI